MKRKQIQSLDFDIHTLKAMGVHACCLVERVIHLNLKWILYSCKIVWVTEQCWSQQKDAIHLNKTPNYAYLSVFDCTVKCYRDLQDCELGWESESAQGWYSCFDSTEKQTKARQTREPIHVLSCSYIILWSTTKLMICLEYYTVSTVAPLRVTASPFTTTTSPSIKAGHTWYITRGAVNSES